jgi:hypothetical protein
MSDNFIIGECPIPEPNSAQLQFHQYIMYDRSWPSGTLKYDAVSGNFYIQADNQPLNNNSISSSEQQKHFIFGPKKN